MASEPSQALSDHLTCEDCDRIQQCVRTPCPRLSKRESLIPNRWIGVDEGDGNPVLWRVEIEHDRFSTTEPFVVSILVSDSEEGNVSALATPSPAEAREMAAALLVYAHFAERDNARDAAVASDEQRPAREGCCECGWKLIGPHEGDQWCTRCSPLAPGSHPTPEEGR